MRIDRIKLVTELAKREWTTQDLAKKSGISRSTVSYIKNGKSCATDTAEKIARALDVEVTDILGE